MLVTRPAHQSDAFARSLETAGAVPVLAPVIAFEAPDDVQAAEQAVTRAPEYTWIVFTSANGVDAFFAFMDARREDARFLGAAKIAAIGSGTAAQLRRRCIYPDLIPQSFIAEDLADALVAATRNGDAVLIFRAQEARDVLPQRLRDEGRTADVVAGYKTIVVHDPQFAEKAAGCRPSTWSRRPSSATAAACRSTSTRPSRANAAPSSSRRRTTSGACMPPHRRRCW